MPQRSTRSCFTFPLTDEIESAERRQRELEEEERAALQREQEFVALSAELAARHDLDEKNRQMLPEDAEIATFLEDLNRLGENSGLKFPLFEPRPEERVNATPVQNNNAANNANANNANANNGAQAGGTAYARIPVNLQLNGQYHQIAKFFYEISKLDRVINLEDVELLQPEVVGEEVVLSARVTATTFRRLAANAPATATPGGR